MVDDYGKSVLHYAAVINNSIISTRLCELGADPTIPDKDGKTAIDHARERGFADLAELLQNPPAPTLATTEPPALKAPTILPQPGSDSSVSSVASTASSTSGHSPTPSFADMPGSGLKTPATAAATGASDSFLADLGETLRHSGVALAGDGQDSAHPGLTAPPAAIAAGQATNRDSFTSL